MQNPGCMHLVGAEEAVDLRGILEEKIDKQ
jgi:hypothetical protein